MDRILIVCIAWVVLAIPVALLTGWYMRRTDRLKIERRTRQPLPGAPQALTGTDESFSESAAPHRRHSLARVVRQCVRRLPSASYSLPSSAVPQGRPRPREEEPPVTPGKGTAPARRRDFKRATSRRHT